MAKTADSGVTWAAASASPPNANNIYVISLFNASVGLAAGVDSTPGEGIWYTSDGGDNWTQAVSGPTTTVNSIIMTSATVGFAVDSSNNIWKTVDAGANWTDTTDNLANTKYRIFSEDATTIYFVDKASPSVQKYVNATSGPVSAGTLTNIFVASVGNTSSATSNVVLGSDGNYYWAYAPGTGTANAQVDIIRIFKWDGTSISMRDVPMACNEELKTRWWIADVGNTSVLIEVDGVLYLNVWDVILKIPLSTEGE